MSSAKGVRNSQPREPAERASRRHSSVVFALIALAIVGLSVLAFWPGVYGGFVWDDAMLITGNPSAGGLSASQLGWMFSTFHSGHYQPLLWTSYGLDAELWGLDPLGYHLTSLLIHVLATLAAWALARRLFAAASGNLQDWAAPLAALLFGLHPLRVETVSWVAGRLDSLAALFLFVSVWAYLRAWEDGRRGARWRTFSCAAFAASLLTKASGMGLPLVLLLLDAWPLRRFVEPARRRAELRAAVVEKLPFLALSVAGAALALVARGHHGALEMEEYGVLRRTMQVASGLIDYPLRTLLPLGLSPLYELRPSFDPLAPRYLAKLVVALAVTALALFSRRRFPALCVAWFSYLILVAPVSGIAQAGTQVSADRYTYLPMLPLVLLAVGALARPGPRTVRVAVQTALALAVVMLGLLSRAQTRIWRDEITLWQHAVELDIESPGAHYNLGLALARAGRPEDALREFSTTIRLRPGGVAVWGNRAEVQAGLGNLEAALSDLDQHLRRSPGDPKGWANRGLVRQALGDHAGALPDFDRALELGPDARSVRVKRAASRAAMGRTAEAIEDLERVLAETPPADPRHAELGALVERLRARAAADR